jgi:hypothetical protein
VPILGEPWVDVDVDRAAHTSEHALVGQVAADGDQQRGIVHAGEQIRLGHACHRRATAVEQRR